jgi:hypothetical protein
MTVLCGSFLAGLLLGIVCQTFHKVKPRFPKMNIDAPTKHWRFVRLGFTK